MKRASLRVPPLTEITRACDFSDNVGFPFGRRRFYAIRNPAFAQAFTAANQDRLWTDAIRKRDDWISRHRLRGADRRCTDRVARLAGRSPGAGQKQPFG